MAQKQPHYKAAVLAGVLAPAGGALPQLYGPGSGAFPQPGSRRTVPVWCAAPSLFYADPTQQPLTIDDICREVGFSKFYFCRVFHEGNRQDRGGLPEFSAL